MNTTKIIIAAFLVLLISLNFAEAQKKSNSKNKTKIKDEDNSVSLFMQGQQDVSDKKYQEAIDCFTKVIKMTNNNIGAYYNRGTSYLYLGKAIEAIQDFDQVLSIDSNYTDAYNNRGLAYSFIQNLEKAKADFDKSIALDPNFTEAYINRGSFFMVTHKFDSAMVDFNKAIDLKAKNPEVYIQRARLFYKTDEYQKVIKDLDVVINTGIQNADIYYLRANSYFKLKNYKEAIDDYTKAIQLNPNASDARNNRAISYEKLDMNAEAEKDRDTLLELAKNNPHFPSINKLKFVTYKDSSGLISLDLPEGWHVNESDKEDNIDIIISIDSLPAHNSPYSTGVSISYNKNMEKNYKVFSPEKLLEFWESSAGMNAEDYYKYNLFSRSSKKFGEYVGYINKVMVQPKETSLPMRAYEVVLAKNNVLFYAYFQSLENEFAYYEQIYEKSINSLVLK